jgi:Protein of unknown function (DUF2840)
MKDQNIAPLDDPTLISAPEAQALTHIELIWQAKRIEQWICFGRSVDHVRLDEFRRRVSFVPDAIFAFVRWAANDYGTILSRIDILRAVRAGQCYSTLSGVRPGGEILLSIDGWPKVERVLQAIDRIRALRLDPAAVAPEHWRHVHNRLTVGAAPRTYTLVQHLAWIKRRRIVP